MLKIIQPLEDSTQHKDELIELIHFIKTPLASIKIGGVILKDVLPILIDTYKNKKIIDGQPIINNHTLNNLMLVIENISSEANRISTHIENIQIK